MPPLRLRTPAFRHAHAWNAKCQMRTACAALAVFGAVLQGCAPEPAGQDSADPAIVRRASSSTFSELGVASWKVVQTDATGAHIFGLDESRTLRVEVFARTALAPAPEGVRIKVVHPMAGEFAMSPSGDIDGTASAGLQRIAAALFRDLGQAGEAKLATRVDETGRENAKAGVSVSALGSTTLVSWGGAIYFGGLFGERANKTVGFRCLQGYKRDHYAAYSDNGSSCWIIDWATEDPVDCQVRLHYGIAPFQNDTCWWNVYGDPI